MLWTIALHYDLVADGEPLEITTNQILEWFAIEFTGDDLATSLNRHKDGQEYAQGIYGVNAEVIFADDSAIVLDFGICAVGDPKYLNLPGDIRKGQFVAGTICLAIPLCTAPYPEDLNGLLQARLHIRKMLAENTTLQIKRDARDFITIARDPEKRSYVEVRSITKPWNQYLLICESAPRE